MNKYRQTEYLNLPNSEVSKLFHCVYRHTHTHKCSVGYSLATCHMAYVGLMGNRPKLA